MENEFNLMKRYLKVIVLLLFLPAIVLVGTFLILRNDKSAGEATTLPDGTRLRVLGTAVGPDSYYRSTFWNVINRLPAPAYKQVIKLVGEPPFPNFGTPIQSSLMIWLELSAPVSDSPTQTIAMLRAPGGQLSGHGARVDLFRPLGASNSVTYIDFTYWPRHAESIECVLLQGDLNKSEVVGSFRFENPSRTAAPAWTPDPVPTTKAADDLKVTLLNFATRFRTNLTERDKPYYKVDEDGRHAYFRGALSSEEKQSLVKLAFDSPGGTNEIWTTYNAELSDGFGNSVDALLRAGMTTNLVLTPVLWPDEAAWKLKLRLKKTRGFRPDELLTISNVPLPSVGTTNKYNLTNITMGVQTVFKQFIRKAPDAGRSSIRFEHDDFGDTNQIDLISVNAHPASTNTTPWGGVSFHTASTFYFKSIPTNATHMDFVFSVQKARLVEFAVAPNWTTNEYVTEEQ